MRVNDYEAKETFEQIVAQIVKRLNRETVASADLDAWNEARCRAATSLSGSMACAQRRHA